MDRASTSISLSAYLRLVRHNRNFRKLWLAQIVSEIGDWFYTLAIYSLLLQLTGRRVRWRSPWCCRCFVDRGHAGKSWSILAAMMKSLCVRPSILCVHNVISALPQASRMSG
jgi:hypothetical protein